jgi:hypothetical protein
LAAFFTAPNVIVHGPTDLDSLSKSKVCYLLEEWLPFTTVPAFVQSIVFPPTPPPDIAPSSLADIRYRIDGCMALMRSGEVDAMVDQDVRHARSMALHATREIHDVACLALHALCCAPLTFTRCSAVALRRVWQIFLAIIVNDMYSCKDWTIVPNLDFAPQFQSLVFRDDAFGIALARNVSVAFADFVTKKEYGEMMSNQLGLKQTCEADNEEGDTTAIKLEDMKGLFFVVAASMAASILAGVVGWSRRSFGQKQNATVKRDDENAEDLDLDDLTQGEMLRLLLERVEKLDRRQDLNRRLNNLGDRSPTSPWGESVQPQSTPTVGAVDSRP